jgi:EamA domain-containing membrane protein RarD
MIATLFFGVFKRYVNVVHYLPPDIIKIILGVLCVIIVGFFAIYFSSQNKMTEAIEHFEVKSSSEKIFWALVSAIVLIGPICLFPFLFTKV